MTPTRLTGVRYVSEPRYIVRMECHMALPEWRHRPPYGGGWAIWDQEEKRIPDPVSDHIFEPLQIERAYEHAVGLNLRDGLIAWRPCQAIDYYRDENDRIVVRGFCQKPSGHASRFHQEWRDGKIWSEWSGPRPCTCTFTKEEVEAAIDPRHDRQCPYRGEPYSEVQGAE